VIKGQRFTCVEASIEVNSLTSAKESIGRRKYKAHTVEGELVLAGQVQDRTND